jgi:quinol monooxygenase YgiN
MPIVIIARWYPRPERLEDFFRIVGSLKDSLTPEMVAAFSVLLLTMSRDGAVVFIERWNSEEVMNGLRSSPIFHDSIRKMSDCCYRPLEIEHLSTTDTEGIIASLRPIEPARYPPGKSSRSYYPDLGRMTPVYV